MDDVPVSQGKANPENKLLSLYARQAENKGR